MNQKNFDISDAMKFYQEVSIGEKSVGEAIKNYQGKRIIVSDLDGNNYFGRLECKALNGNSCTHLLIIDDFSSDEVRYLVSYAKLDKIFAPPL